MINFWIAVFVASAGYLGYAGVKPEHPNLRELARAVMWAGVFCAVYVLAISKVLLEPLR